MMVSNPSLGVGRCHDVLLNVGLSIWRYRKIGHLGARKLKKVLSAIGFKCMFGLKFLIRAFLMLSRAPIPTQQTLKK